MNTIKKSLGIYLHIPFCVKKCNYCDFLSFPAGEEIRSQYVSRLIEEMDQFEEREDYLVDSVFLGGGTPSLLKEDQIFEILQRLQKRFAFTEDCEITMECNPGTVTKEKLTAFLEAGGNRLSFGLQSADDRELKVLGRIHRMEDFRKSFALARKVGCQNINIDLMSALPGQTLESWTKTLLQAVSMNPEHISAYSLIIEEGTRFADWYGTQKTAEPPYLGTLPDEDTEREMYYTTEKLLAQYGFRRYEISNYARPGKESRHNLRYWQRKDYLGLGLGASSFLEPLRWKNTTVLEDYLSGDFSKNELEVLTKDNQIEETMYLGLRMTDGISKDDFQKKFHCSMDVIYGPKLQQLHQKGLLKNQSQLSLTPLGIDLSNQVLSEFLL